MSLTVVSILVATDRSGQAGERWPNHTAVTVLPLENPQSAGPRLVITSHGIATPVDSSANLLGRMRYRFPGRTAGLSWNGGGEPGELKG